MPPNTEIVSLIYHTMTGNDTAEIFVELIKEGAQWKLISIVLSPTSYKGKNVDDYVNLARKAREAGKLRLAILYYKFAYLLSDLSPNVDEFVSRKVSEEMAQVKADYIPAGTPQVWNVDAETKPEVFNVDVIIDKNEPGSTSNGLPKISAIPPRSIMFAANCSISPSRASPNTKSSSPASS